VSTFDESSSSSASAYDEFGLLHENAEEVGLPFDTTRPPLVERVAVDAPSGNVVSALVWGDEEPELVLLHGGAQNAHTWDTVALALNRPLVAIDLPGHGHSAWRDDKTYRPTRLAEDVTYAVGELAPKASTLAGMSLGGLTALCVMAETPSVADRLALIDITPGVNHEKAEPILSFISGPDTFASFDEILERTMAYNPTRSRSSLRRGVLHNATQRRDGTWAWRYDLPIGERVEDLETRFADLWDAVDTLRAPLLLVQGGLSGVVDDEDVAELQRRKPDAQVLVVEEAGHSVQGDRPIELAEILTSFHQGPLTR
jgi:pimeloyl-ACP methyl ester carboxylesterase